MYERGTGVQKNMSTALKWYEQAGSAGNVKAMHNAAVIAAGSDAGGPDYARAFKWFGLAANHGLKDSEFNLAVLLERGLGTKQDTAQALFWYMAAAAQDDADAKARVELISKTMDQADVDAVAQRFKGWSPQKASDAANVVAVDDSQWNPSSSSAKAPINKQSMLENPNDQAKRLLEQMGYRVGSLDGTLDAKTANAIKLFQIKEGLKATGRVTPDLLDKMQDSVG
jgi:localization factor PodJL